MRHRSYRHEASRPLLTFARVVTHQVRYCVASGDGRTDEDGAQQLQLDDDAREEGGVEMLVDRRPTLSPTCDGRELPFEDY